MRGERGYGRWDLMLIFPCRPKPLFQSEARCEAIDVKMISYSLANKTHFHKKGFELSLLLKVRNLDFGKGLFFFETFHRNELYQLNFQLADPSFQDKL